MHDSDNSLGAVRDDKRGDGKTLHHFDRFGCQLIRSNQLGMARGQGPGVDLGKIPALLDKAPQVAVGNHTQASAPARSTTVVMPSFLADISRMAYRG